MKNRFCHYLILDQEFSKGEDMEKRHKSVMDRYRKIVDSAVEELRRSSDDEAKFGQVAILSDLGLLCIPEVVRKRSKKSNPANEFLCRYFSGAAKTARIIDPEKYSQDY